MVDAPKRVKLLLGEEVIRKSRGMGPNAVLYFDEAGEPLTKKPCMGHVYLTNQRFILEVHELSSALQNAGAYLLDTWPVVALIDVAVSFKNITEVSKSRRLEQD